MTVTVNATVWGAGLRNSLHRLSLDFAFRSPCVNRYLVNARALTGLCTQPKIAA